MEGKKKKFITKETIIACAIGFAVGLVLMLVLGLILNLSGMAKLKYGSDAIASVNGKSIKTNTIYEKMKMSNGLSILINEIDKAIIDDMYTLTEKDLKEANEEAEYYINYYEAMGYSKEEFLEAYGFKNYDEFLDEIKLNIKSNKYLDDYLEKKLEDGAVQQYYDDNKDVYESYDSEHILVEIKDDVTDEQALALANEIIEKLNDGKSFKDVAEEYKDKVIFEELGYQTKLATLEQTYIDELVALKDGEYSKEPIKTSYGYHIVHKIATSKFEDAKSEIIEILAEDIIAEDANLRYKAFIELRENKGLKIYDETLEKQYKEYKDRVYESDED